MQLTTPNVDAVREKVAARCHQQLSETPQSKERQVLLARYTDDKLASMSIRQLSKTFNMSKTTLLYRINTARKTRREAIALPTQYHSPLYSDCI